MGSFIYGQDEQLAQWAVRQLGPNEIPRPDTKAIGYQTGGILRAVVYFDNHSDANVDIHISSDGSRTWCTREFLRVAFAYPFIQCRYRRVTGLIPARNEQALKFNRALGFTEEGFIRHGMPDDDVIIMGLLREECRFIPDQYRTQP